MRTVCLLFSLCFTNVLLLSAAHALADAPNPPLAINVGKIDVKLVTMYDPTYGTGDRVMMTVPLAPLYGHGLTNLHKGSASITSTNNVTPQITPSLSSADANVDLSFSPQYLITRQPMSDLLSSNSNTAPVNPWVISRWPNDPTSRRIIINQKKPLLPKEKIVVPYLLNDSIEKITVAHDIATIILDDRFFPTVKRDNRKELKKIAVGMKIAVGLWMTGANGPVLVWFSAPPAPGANGSDDQIAASDSLATPDNVEKCTVPFQQTSIDINSIAFKNEPQIGPKPRAGGEASLNLSNEIPSSCGSVTVSSADTITSPVDAVAGHIELDTTLALKGFPHMHSVMPFAEVG